jgi:hypothetical protein
MLRSGSIVAASLAALCLGAGGCDRTSGTGTVRARFSPAECPPGQTDLDLADYAFEAGYLSTERFQDVLLVQIFRYPVRVEETDGLTFRLDLDALLDAGLLRVDEARGQLVRADPSQPLRLPLTESAALGVNATLSLFQTCPEFPQFAAGSGTLTLTALTLAADPDETGEQERIAGTATATLTRTSTKASVGTLDAAFDFTPPRRPLATFR